MHARTRTPSRAAPRLFGPLKPPQPGHSHDLEAAAWLSAQRLEYYSDAGDSDAI